MAQEVVSQTEYDRNQKFTSSGQNKIPIGMRGSAVNFSDKGIY
jgi:hypothetical protein